MAANTMEKVLPVAKLPTLHPAARMLLEHRDAADPGQVAPLIEQDAALRDQLLAAANSGCFNLDEPCRSAAAAMEILGLRTVRTLVVGFSLIELTKSLGAELDLVAFWRRCLYSAAAARRIAVVTDTCDPESAFLAAMLQDIGMLAMSSVFGAKYVDVLGRASGNHQRLPHWERAALGFSHAEAGAFLGEHWGMSGELLEPIRHHHAKVTRSHGFDATTNAVALACRITGHAITEGGTLDTVRSMGADLFDLSEKQTAELLQQTEQDTRGFSALLDESTDASDILRHANNALVQHQSDVRRETPAAPPAAKSERPAEAELFLRHLATAFAEARQDDCQLGLILLELDHAHRLREAAGDAVVESVCQALVQRVEHAADLKGIVEPIAATRYAILAPGVTLVEAARLAELLRQVIADDPFTPASTADRRTIAVTASVGVAVLEPALRDMMTRPRQLLEIGHNALQAARSAGRNCVRVFRPRLPAAGAR